MPVQNLVNYEIVLKPVRHISQSQSTTQSGRLCQKSRVGGGPTAAEILTSVHNITGLTSGCIV